MVRGRACKGPDCRRRVWNHLGPEVLVRIREEQNRREGVDDLVSKAEAEFYACCDSFIESEADSAERVKRKVHLRSKDHITRVLFEQFRDHVSVRSLRSF